MKTFMSYNRRDYDFVNLVVKQFKSKFNFITTVFFDKENVKPGDNWVEDTQSSLMNCDVFIVFIGNNGLGSWQTGEVLAAKNREGLKRIVLILPNTDKENIPFILSDVQWIEFKDAYDQDGLEELTSALLKDAITTEISPNAVPYKGLDFFDVEDSPFFFGRMHDINRIFNRRLRLRPGNHNHFLAIVGDSGSGKSSFARAGILAAMKDRFKDGEQWKQIIFTPADNPLFELFATLESSGIVSNGERRVIDSKSNFYTLRWALDTYVKNISGGSKMKKIIIMIDQFEEVMTQCKDNQVREAFLQNILVALKSENFVCIVTLRSDFYASFSAFKEFADLLESNNCTITSLDYNTTGKECIHYLRSIIETPAKLMGICFDPVLTMHIIEDCKGINGVLPTLQLALITLWKNRRDKTKIDSIDYSSLANGQGIAGIIEAHADSVWRELTMDGPHKISSDLIKAIFIKLVEITGNNEDVRKTITKADIIDDLCWQFDQSPIEVDEALNKLSGPENRLIRIRVDKKGKNIYWVEVVHEVLIRKWSMLREWLDEKRKDIRYKNKLEFYSDDDNKLLTGKNLAYAKQWVKNNKNLTSVKINNFIKISDRMEKKRKNLIYFSLSTLVLLAVSIWLWIQVRECQNCDLVIKYKTANYNIDSIHVLSLEGTKDLKFLRCFQNLDTLLLEKKEGEDWLFQRSLDYLPKDLKQLSLTAFKIEDTVSLASFTQLKTLRISSIDSFQKIIIANLTELEELEISYTNEFTSIECVKGGKDLQTLSLSSLNNFHSLEGIKNFEKLQTLKLSSLKNLSSLEGIDTIRKLQTLILSDLPIPGISHIKNLNKLQNLVLSNLRINDLTGIENLRDLRSLEIVDSSKPLISIAHIKNLTNLQSLSLSNQFIPDLKDIDSLNQLESLSLSHLNNLSSLKDISNLTKLRTLTLSSLKISDLTEIETLKNLQILNLSNLKLSSLHVIANLDSLQSLVLSNLQIDSLIFIEHFKNIKLLYLTEINPLSNEYVFIPKLTNQESIDTLKLHSIRLKSLDFIDNKLNVKTIIYDGTVQTPKMEKDFKEKREQMKLTTFLSLDQG